MRISYSFGMVDLLHYGHIKALKQAACGADINIFGIVDDDASDALYGSHVSRLSERIDVLESINCVDRVMIQSTFDPIENLRKLHAEYPAAEITLFYGKEWGVLSSKNYLESIGGKFIKLDYYDKLSPERILEVLNSSSTPTKTKNNLISTKANTLASLKEVLSKSLIEDLLIVTIGEFNSDSSACVERIKQYFSGHGIVVRSSSKREDAYEESNAGHFTSVLGIDSNDDVAVMNALNDVIDSYGANPEIDEQVLIQRQTDDVLISGVVFTRDIQKNRPYYVINYDDSGSTDSVTSGVGGKTAWLSKSVTEDYVPLKWGNLMNAVWEIEDILPGILLDIEFAITSTEVVIFQVRPLAAAYKFGRSSNQSDVDDIRNRAVEKYRYMKNKKLTCFSDMAFWNPAEIIGDNPKNLDYSLYREIVTKEAWDMGLVSMGYRSVPAELMCRFGNKPYISLERAFEALIPSVVSESLVDKLCKYYIEKLKEDLSAHDKIEFEISHNCYDFSMHGRLAELMSDGFSTSEVLELENALRTLTIKVISDYPDTLEKDLSDLNQLEGIRLDVQNITKNCNDFKKTAKGIHTLLDAINKFGTPQFSRQARCAFIAKSLCKSLVTEGFIESDEYNLFMTGINTIAVDYDKDYKAVGKGRLSKEQFNHKYGHLRAGTYNIRSPRYDQMGQMFQDAEAEDSIEKHETGNIDKIICVALEKAITLRTIDGLEDPKVLSFIKTSIEQREYFKFIFTRSLSFAMELIKQIGADAGISVNDLSYIEIPEIYAVEYYTDLERLYEFWSLVIDQRKDLYKTKSDLILPSVIGSEMDFSYIENIDSRPNFITENKVTGEVLVLEDGIERPMDGKIVVIEKADPGYDWIFSKGIAGLVTKYGGAASHMAIRCAEFKIPAAIGSGTKLYEYAAGSKILTIDCTHEKIIREER